MSIFDDIGQFLNDVWQVIVDIFSSAPPPGPLKQCHEYIFEAHIIGVQFNSPVYAARRGVMVTGEHWTDGVDVTEPNVADGSTKPAIVLIDGRGDPGMTLRIRVTRSQNVDSSGQVSGYLGGLTFNGKEPCLTGVGDHTIQACIVQLHPVITRDAGDASWSMNVAPLGPVSLGSTRLELMTILDNPPAFLAGGVWIEALRTMCYLGALGVRQKRKAAATVAQFCHAGMGAVYDTVSGAPKFNSGQLGANGFLLAKYISPGIGKVVNCYDQAAAVSALAGSLGVTLDWKFMNPFGFLAQSDLVGVGGCNNPFFKGYDRSGQPWNPAPITPPGDLRRSSFGNHAFTAFRTSINSDIAGPDSGVAEGIGDGCAGPAIFDGTLQDYVVHAVDQSRPYNLARQAEIMQFGAIDSWENSENATINSLPGLDQGDRDSSLAAIHAIAEQARANVWAQVAAIETGDVKPGVGVNSLQFSSYTGP
jgi:hypothetical protein